MNTSPVIDVEFSKLYKRNYRRVVAVGKRILADPQLAEDVAQATMLRAYLQLQEGSEGNWGLIRKVAKDIALNIRRDRRDQLGHVPDRESPDASPYSAMLGETVAELTTAVAALPPQHRQAIRLAYWEEMSIAQIAQVQESSAVSVKNRLYYARELLRSKLRGVRLIIPGLGSGDALRIRMFQEGLHAAFVSLVSVAALTTLTPTPLPSHNAQPILGSIPTAEHVTRFDSPSETAPVSSQSRGAPAEPQSHRHQMGEPISAGTGEPEDEPGSAGVVIGPIGVNCDPQHNATMMKIICGALFPEE